MWILNKDIRHRHRHRQEGRSYLWSSIYFPWRFLLKSGKNYYCNSENNYDASSTYKQLKGHIGPSISGIWQKSFCIKNHYRSVYLYILWWSVSLCVTKNKRCFEVNLGPHWVEIFFNESFCRPSPKGKQNFHMNLVIQKQKGGICYS